MLKRYKFVMCSYNYPSFFLGIRSKRLRERLRKIEGGENNMFMDHRIKVGVIPTRRVDMSFALDRALYYKDLVFKKLDEFGVEYVTVEDVCADGILGAYSESDAVIEKMRREKVDALFFVHVNFELLPVR